jgi:hypothetical protein
MQNLRPVGDSPRGPLKQLGNPHLKPAIKPKPNTPYLTVQDMAHAAKAPAAHQAAHSKTPSNRYHFARGCAPPSGGFRLARGSAPPSSEVRLARGRPARARLLPRAGIKCPDIGGTVPSCAQGTRPGAAAPTPQEGAHPDHCGGGDCAARPVPRAPAPVRLTHRALEGGPAAPSICFLVTLQG